LLHAPTALITNSETGYKGAVARGISERCIRVLSNVIDLDAFDRMSSAPAGDLPANNDVVVLAVANPRPVKRLDRFLEAVALARREHPGLQAWVAGVGPEQEKVEDHARRLQLDGSAFRMLGRRDDVPSVLQQADMLVLSSDHEGFPNVILEAMAARLPVVTTPAGDAGLVVRRSGAGYVVPFDDVAEMARRMVELARDSDLRRRLGYAGRKFVEQHHCPAALPGRLQRIYNEFAWDLGREELGLRIVRQRE
jgi:glycosyltransferase involved in cell wall biosynthesis